MFLLAAGCFQEHYDRMKHSKSFVRSISILSVVVAAFLPSVSSQAAQEGLASWSGVFINGKFNGGPWGYFLESQTRLQQNTNTQRGNRFMLRAAVKYAIDSRFGVAFGYAWTPNFSPLRNENRIYQQFNYTENMGSWLIGARSRFEQRRIEHTAEKIAHRFRQQVRFNYYLDQDRKFAAVFTDEFFWHLNTVPNGPKSGFDQNRAFIGPNIAVSKEAHIEFGYMNVHVNSPSISTDDLISHTMVTYVFLDF